MVEPPSPLIVKNALPAEVGYLVAVDLPVIVSVTIVLMLSLQILRLNDQSVNLSLRCHYTMLNILLMLYYKFELQYQHDHNSSITPFNILSCTRCITKRISKIYNLSPDPILLELKLNELVNYL